MIYGLLYITGHSPNNFPPNPTDRSHLGPGFFKRNQKMWTMRWVCWAWMVFGKVDATGLATFDLWGRWVEFPYLKHLLPRPHGLRFNHVVHIWFEYVWYFWHIHMFLERNALNMWGKTFVSGSIGAKFGYYITEIWAEPESDAVDIELPSWRRRTICHFKYEKTEEYHRLKSVICSGVCGDSC